jgi:hypothetical protein
MIKYNRTTPDLTQYPLAFPEYCNIFYGADANGKIKTFHPSGEIALQLISASKKIISEHSDGNNCQE